MKNLTLNLIVYFVLLNCLTGCDHSGLNIGKKPDFNKIDTSHQDKEGVGLDALASAHLSPNNNKVDKFGNYASNSLWRPGSRTFFRDKKARSIGDIIKVKIVIQDKAVLDNKTQKKRDSSGRIGIPKFLGIEETLKNSTNIDPTKVIDISGAKGDSGEGKIDRKETVNTTVAATVIRILPSNNLLIKGAQEIRVNDELREITIGGIVRPEDIGNDNSVSIEQIAEARISYGGRGQITDYQKPRYGSQILDVLAPF